MRTIQVVNALKFHGLAYSRHVVRTILLGMSLVGAFAALIGAPTITFFAPLVAYLLQGVYLSSKRRRNCLRIYWSATPDYLDSLSRARVLAAAVDQKFSHAWLWGQQLTDPTDPALLLSYRATNAREDLVSPYDYDALVEDLTTIDNSRVLAAALTAMLPPSSVSRLRYVDVIAAIGALTRYCASQDLDEDLIVALLTSRGAHVCEEPSACSCIDHVRTGVTQVVATATRLTL